MNAPSNPTACEHFEHEIADLVDGLLPDTEMRRVRAHLAACPACRAWHAEYASVDAAFGSALPSPALSPGFEAALMARVQGLRAANGRAARRAAADAEHDALLTSLLHHSRRNAILGALGGALSAGSALVFLQRLLQEEPAVQSAVQGADRLMVFGGLGAIIALGVIGWTLWRSAIVTPRLARW
jgi:anti-sigma factor RsiW